MGIRDGMYGRLGLDSTFYAALPICKVSTKAEAAVPDTVMFPQMDKKKIDC